MHISAPLVTLFALFPVFGLAVPAATPSKASSTLKAAASKTSAGASSSSASSTDAAAMNMNPAAMTPSDTQVMNAVMSWMNDTGKVSKFLNTATSFSGDEFTRQATIALNAEKDELNHKMILDMAVGTSAMVQSANDTLATQGTFQAVVDALQSMMTNGPDTAQAQVDAINQNRCVNVLPNIDMYFAAAGMPDMQSIRPSGCLEVANAAASPAAQMPADGASNASDPAASDPATNATTSSSAASKTTAKPSGTNAPKAAASATSGSAAGVKASATSNAGVGATGKSTGAGSGGKATSSGTVLAAAKATGSSPKAAGAGTAKTSSASGAAKAKATT